MFKHLNFLFLIVFIGTSTAEAQSLKIIQKPIVFDSTRTKLSLAYLKQHHNLQQKTPTIVPKIIVLHWTAANTMLSTYHAFNTSVLPKDRTAIAGASSLNVSSHYLIDRDGTVYQLLPDTVFARHVIGLNYCAIGIENVGSDANPLTTAQLYANEKLVRFLSKKYNIKYLIGHYEYLEFKKTALWRETDNNYSTQKTDPGISFMQKIRQNLKDLNLKGAPN